MPNNSFTSRSRRPNHKRAYHASPNRFGGNKRGPKKDNIHPSKFIKPARPVEVEAYVPQNSFLDFAINDLLKANIARKGFVDPSPIQDQAIPAGLQGRDVIGIANTGTGKTAAFAIPALQKLMDDKQSRVLIMAPTRELAQQIEDECRQIGKGSGVMGALLIGGSSMGIQLRDLKARPRIVIGTPGRIKDHMERRSLDLSGFNMVVLDEVDRMLDMGFIQDMQTILAELSPVRQSFFFSATFDGKVATLVNQFVNDPITISVKTGETSDNVEQNIVKYGGKHEKMELLHDLLVQDHHVKVLVFDDTQRSVERLSDELIARGFKADSIHGGKTQGQRQRALKRFKGNEISVLVATDVAARGIDVADITSVINYSTPQTYDDYIHRIGRAGRAGRTGLALTFISR